MEDLRTEIYVLQFQTQRNNQDDSIDFVGVYSSPEQVEEAKAAYLEWENIELPLRYGIDAFRICLFYLDAMPNL